MTDREKAIVMAHTGICMLEGERLGVFYQYLNELYGRPVYTHEWLTLDIKEKSKPDFLQLCKEEESSAEHFDERIDSISRQAAIDKAITIPIAKIVTEDKVIYRKAVFVEDIRALPSAEPFRQKEKSKLCVESEDLFPDLPQIIKDKNTEIVKAYQEGYEQGKKDAEWQEKWIMPSYCPNCGAKIDGNENG